MPKTAFLVNYMTMNDAGRYAANGNGITQRKSRTAGMEDLNRTLLSRQGSGLVDRLQVLDEHDYFGQPQYK